MPTNTDWMTRLMGSMPVWPDAIADCEAIICGGMGMGAYESMKRLNIKPFVTDCLDPEIAVQSYIDGKLIDHIEKLH